MNVSCAVHMYTLRLMLPINCVQSKILLLQSILFHFKIYESRVWSTFSNPKAIPAKFGSVSNRPKCGRPRKTIARENWLICREVY